jgi:hypothetical protein
MTTGPLALDSDSPTTLVHPKANEVAFGLDLAGLRGSNSRLARAQRNQGSGCILVTVFVGSGVPHGFEGADLLEGVISSWGRIVERCLQRGTLVVDTPIDVQELPVVVSPSYVWQLTKRPIDYALDAQPPFASWIGYLFSAFRFFAGENMAALGDDLLETYPASSLRRVLRPPIESYKKQGVQFLNNAWHPHDGDAEGLSTLLGRLELQAEQGTMLDDHGLDALLCAITGLGGAFATTEEELFEEVSQILAHKMNMDGQGIAQLGLALVPNGYRLLNTMPTETIRVGVTNVDSLDGFWKPSNGKDRSVVSPAQWQGTVGHICDGPAVSRRSLAGDPSSLGAGIS